MSQETLMYIMAAAVVVSAAAIVIQLIILFGMFFAVRQAKQKFLQLSEKAEPLIETSKTLLETSKTVLEESRTQINEITTKTKEILNGAQGQVTRIDEFLAETTSRAKVQMEHVEMVMDDTLNRVQETGAVLQKGILRPVRQLNGLVAGIQAAIEYLVRRHHTTVEQATQEDEMFI